MKKSCLLLILALPGISLPALAQNSSGFDSLMRSSGRIFVVVAVMLTILAGLILYLVRLDKKISKFEKEQGKTT